MTMKLIIAVISVALVSRWCYGLNATESCSWDSCKDLDNASIAIHREFDKCRCDELCATYQDCCRDSQFYNREEQMTAEKRHHSCVHLKEYGDRYMRRGCGRDWEDSEVAKWCEESPHADDPLAHLPVTSLSTNTTYFNYYCAICSRDAFDVVVWRGRWECPTIDRNYSKEDVAAALVLRDGKWGVELPTGVVEGGILFPPEVDEGRNTFHKCSLFPVPLNTLTNVTRNCTKTVNYCAHNWTDVRTKELCESYTATVYDKDIAYRNPDCAACNNISNFTCTPLASVRLQPGVTDSFDVEAFAILFDFTDGSGSNIVGITSKCGRHEVWDPFFRKCRSVVCGRPDQKFVNNRCIDVSDFNATADTNRVMVVTTGNVSTTTDKSNFTPIIFPDNNREITTTTTTTRPLQSVNNNTLIMNTAVASNNSADLENCTKILLSSGEFILHENGTVLVEQYDAMYEIGEYERNEGGDIIVCLPPRPPTNKFSHVLGWVTLVGLSLSCVCLLIHLFVFTIVEELRNLSGRNLASLCLTLVASYVTFITNVFSDFQDTSCIVLASAMYYFFTASFCWMNAVAFDIWYTFYMTKRELRVSAGKQSHKFIAYSLYSWLLPALALAAVLTVDLQRPEGFPEEFTPRLGKYWCWFGHRKALLIFFAAPVTLLVVVNVVFFSSTAHIITQTSKSTSSITTSNASHKRQYLSYLRLAALMGFTWLSGIAAAYLQVEALWYVFVVLNTLQGVFVFIAFTCRSKVWEAVITRTRMKIQRGASWMSRRMNLTNQSLELKNNCSMSSLSPLDTSVS